MGEPVGAPAAEGYLAHGLTHNVLADDNVARRGTARTLRKLAGHPVTSEVPLPTLVPAPARVPDMRQATIALVTDGGFGPRGKPDGIEPLAAARSPSCEDIDRVRG